MIDKETQEKLIEKYTSERQSGVSFSTIRKDLEQKGLDPASISYIIRQVDQKSTQEDIKQSVRTNTQHIKILGYIFMLGGGVLTIGAFFKLYSLGKYYLIAFVPIIIGYIMIKAASKKEKNAI